MNEFKKKIKILIVAEAHEGLCKSVMYDLYNHIISKYKINNDNILFCFETPEKDDDMYGRTLRNIKHYYGDLMNDEETKTLLSPRLKEETNEERDIEDFLNKKINWIPIDTGRMEKDEDNVSEEGKKRREAEMFENIKNKIDESFKNENNQKELEFIIINIGAGHAKNLFNMLDEYAKHENKIDLKIIVPSRFKNDGTLGKFIGKKPFKYLREMFSTNIVFTKESDPILYVGGIENSYEENLKIQKEAVVKFIDNWLIIENEKQRQWWLRENGLNRSNSKKDPQKFLDLLSKSHEKFL